MDRLKLQSTNFVMKFIFYHEVPAYKSINQSIMRRHLPEMRKMKIKMRLCYAYYFEKIIQFTIYNDILINKTKTNI